MADLEPDAAPDDTSPAHRTVLACVCDSWQIDYRESDWPEVLISLMIEVETIIAEHATTCVALRFALVNKEAAVKIRFDPEDLASEDVAESDEPDEVPDPV